MKLYYASGACSLAPHIVAREAGLKIDLDKLDFATGKTENGETFAEVNPKGVYREPMTLDDYMNVRMVTWPFCLYDCDVPADGCTAVIVSRAYASR